MKRLIPVLLSTLLVGVLYGQDTMPKGNYDSQNYNRESPQTKDDDPWKLKSVKPSQQKQTKQFVFSPSQNSTPWVLSPSITNPPKPAPFVCVQYYWKGDGRCCVPSRNYILTGKLVVVNPK